MGNRRSFWKTVFDNCLRDVINPNSWLKATRAWMPGCSCGKGMGMGNGREGNGKGNGNGEGKGKGKGMALLGWIETERQKVCCGVMQVKL